MSFDGTNNNYDTMLPSMGRKRYLFGAVNVAGRIYVCGGTDGVSATNSVESWSPGDAGWSPEGPMRQIREWHAAVTGPDGRVYALGGADPAGGTVFRSVEAYAVAQKTPRWQAVASMLSTRWAFGAAVGVDGRIYAVGGSNLQGYVTTAEAYGPLFTVTPTSAKAGDTVSISGANFAATARVIIHLGTPTGTALASATSDGNGALAATSVVIPPGTGAASIRLYAVDDKSNYPVSRPFTIQP